MLLNCPVKSWNEYLDVQFAKSIHDQRNGDRLLYRELECGCRMNDPGRGNVDLDSPVVQKSAGVAADHISQFGNRASAQVVEFRQNKPAHHGGHDAQRNRFMQPEQDVALHLSRHSDTNPNVIF